MNRTRRFVTFLLLQCAVCISAAHAAVSIYQESRVGSTYSAVYTAQGGTAPYTWTITSGTLPPGLTLNESTGALAGTFSQGGSYTFHLSVTDSSSTPQTSSYTIRFVIAAPLSVAATASSGSGAAPLTVTL